MTTTTKEPSKRRTVRGVQAQPKGRTQVGGRGPRQMGAADDCGLGGTRSHEGTKVLEVTVEPMPEGLHADGLRYGPLGFVALEVVGVPVKREAGDEHDWCWKRLMRLNEIAREVRVGGQWDVSWRVVDRAERVYLRAQEVWRRMCERWSRIGYRSHGCVSLVVVPGQVVLRRAEQVRVGQWVKLAHLKTLCECVVEAAEANGWCCMLIGSSGLPIWLSEGWVVEVHEGKEAA